MSIAFTSQRTTPRNWPRLQAACDAMKSALAELENMTAADRQAAHAQDQRIAAAVRTISRLCAGS